VSDQVEAKAPKAKRAAKPAVPAEVPAPVPVVLPEVVQAAVEEELSEVAAPVISAVEQAETDLGEVVEATSQAVASDSESIGAEAIASAEEGIEQMATVTTPAEGMEKAQAFFGDMTSRFKTAFEKSSKFGEEFVDFQKGNVEAIVASARVAAKASESFGQEAAEYGKKHFENATAAFKSFAAVKSPTELFQLQSDFAKSSFDSAVAEASRVSESMLKVAGEIVQPLSNRYAVAAEKFKATAL